MRLQRPHAELDREGERLAIASRGVCRRALRVQLAEHPKRPRLPAALTQLACQRERLAGGPACVV
ncbi:MAG: hypothetical protein DME04_15495 [Candidatus Rokuibacteriota bacterium]|nr:MAG: hypothetical protein DME04_15495 [Candidatus Rokubacteria bacterium]